MSDLISKLGKVAVTGNVAILLLGQTITRVRSDTGALLYPSISGTAWDAGIRSRIVLFRDWLFQSKHGSSQMEQKPGVRFARVSKTKGVAYEGVGKVAAFVIEMVTDMKSIEIMHTLSGNRMVCMNSPWRKRRWDPTYHQRRSHRRSSAKEMKLPIARARPRMLDQIRNLAGEMLMKF